MPFACWETIKTPAQQIEELIAKVASLEAELAIQKGIVAALLKRIYGPASEKMDHNQLLMEFLGDEAKKPAAAAPADQGPVADLSKPRARRTSRLSQSLKGLPTVVREIIHPKFSPRPESSACSARKPASASTSNPQPSPLRSSSGSPTSAKTKSMPCHSPRR